MKDANKSRLLRDDTFEDFLELLFNLMEKSGAPDRSVQVHLLVHLIVNDPELMKQLEERNPTLAQQMIQAARSKQLITEGIS